MNNKLILNPTENFPMYMRKNFNNISGFYVSDEIRTADNKIIFAGRNEYTLHVKK